MAKPTRKEILNFWKETIGRNRKSDHYDLTEKSEWVEGYIKLAGKVKELEALDSEHEIRNNLREIFLPTSGLIWSSVPFLFFKLLNEAKFDDIKDIKKIIIDIRNSDEFKKEWVMGLSNLVAKNFPDGSRATSNTDIIALLKPKYEKLKGQKSMTSPTKKSPKAKCCTTATKYGKNLRR